MTIFLEALFVIEVIADTWLTYRIIDSGKGVEVGLIAKYYIHDKLVTILLSIMLVGFLIFWLRLTGLWWFLIPVDLYMGRRVYLNWKIWRG